MCTKLLAFCRKRKSQQQTKKFSETDSNVELTLIHFHLYCTLSSTDTKFLIQPVVVCQDFPTLSGCYAIFRVYDLSTFCIASLKKVITQLLNSFDQFMLHCVVLLKEKNKFTLRESNMAPGFKSTLCKLSDIFELNN